MPLVGTHTYAPAAACTRTEIDLRDECVSQVFAREIVLEHEVLPAGQAAHDGLTCTSIKQVRLLRAHQSFALLSMAAHCYLACGTRRLYDSEVLQQASTDLFYDCD